MSPSDGPSSDSPEPGARPTVLFIAAEPPVPPHNGVRRKSNGLLRALTTRAEVHLVAYAMPDEVGDESSIKAAIPGLASSVVVRRQKYGFASRLLAVTPSRLHRKFYKAASIPRRIQDGSYDLVHLDTFVLLHLAELDLDANVKILSVNDAYSRLLTWVRPPRPRWIGHLAIAYWRKLVQRRERAAADLVDFIDVVAQPELDYLRSIDVPNGRLVTLGRPDGHDLPRDAGSPPTAGIMVHLGGDIAWRLQEFLDDVWPSVIDRVPAARLIVVGRSAGASPDLIETISSDASIVHIERTSTVADFLSQIDVAVVLQDGRSGISNKAIEAMANGRAVVGMRQLENLPVDGRGKAFLIANNHGELADLLAMTLADGSRRDSMQAAGLELMSRWPSWNEVVDRYLAAVAR